MAPLEDELDDVDEVLAGEYVAGLTSAADRMAVRDRMRSDLEFAQIVDRWETKFADLTDEVREVKPPSSTWKEVERRAFGLTPEKETRLQRALNFWRRVSFGTIGMVAGAVAVLQPAETDLFQAEPYIATLRPVPSAEVMVAWLHGRSGLLTIEPYTADLDANERVRAWLLLPGMTPVPLGTVDARATTRMEIPETLWPLPTHGLRIALTLEPIEVRPAAAQEPPSEFHVVADLRRI